MQGIIQAQGWAPWHWFLFHSPFTFAAFFIFFVAALAEGNRTPFDLPEAESELVAGFCTEYSGMRYLLFFLAEWGNLYVIGAIVTTLFLGGWQVPHVTDNPVLLAALQFVTFFLKSYFWVFIAMWVRAATTSAGMPVRTRPSSPATANPNWRSAARKNPFCSKQ